MTLSRKDNSLRRKLVSISILLMLYIFTGLISQDIIFEEVGSIGFRLNIELMVAATASIIFGGFIGGILGGAGYFLLQIIYRLIGVVQEPIGFTELIRTVAYVFGYSVIGWFAKNKTKQPIHFRSVIFSKTTWYNMITNFFATMLGLGIIANTIISFEISGFKITAFFTNFLTRFYYDFQLTITVLPFLLLFFNIIEVIRNKRAKKLDNLYQKLEESIEVDGPAEIVNIQFKDHGLQVGRWTPIQVTFKHTWKAGRSYHIETVSTSKIYPHIDLTSVLNENETWTHTFFVQPLEQDHVEIRIRIHPNHTIKYKEEPKQQTVISITGQTYIQRDLLLIGVVILSEVVLTFFLFSILWTQLRTIFVQEVLGATVNSEEVSSITVPWNLLIAIGGIEALLFIPFLWIMYKLQKPPRTEYHDQVLAFSQDIKTHKYESKDQHSWIREKLVYITYLINLIVVLISTYFSAQILFISRDLIQEGELKVTISELTLLTSITVLCWTITLILLSQTTDMFDNNENISVDKKSYILGVETLSQLKVYKPSEILFTVKNVSKTPGLRISFEGSDAISPPLIELHIDPGETAYFKTSITPSAKGDQEILAIIYPLFNENKEYLPIEDCQPETSHNINYHVLGQTIVGITEGQARTLRHIFGWGSLITSTIAIANEYVGLEETIRQWQETIPFLATIQIPFLYIYYLFSNRFLTSIDTT